MEKTFPYNASLRYLEHRQARITRTGGLASFSQATFRNVVFDARRYNHVQDEYEVPVTCRESSILDRYLARYLQSDTHKSKR